MWAGKPVVARCRTSEVAGCDSRVVCWGPSRVDRLLMPLRARRKSGKDGYCCNNNMSLDTCLPNLS